MPDKTEMTLQQWADQTAALIREWEHPGITGRDLLTMDVSWLPDGIKRAYADYVTPRQAAAQICQRLRSLRSESLPGGRR